MATQIVDFKKSGADADSGENIPSAVRPYSDQEDATAAVFNRPVENLRGRTETVRTLLESLLYLNDADRALLLSGGGVVNFSGTRIEITQNLVLRPFLATRMSTGAKLFMGTPGGAGITVQTIASTVGAVNPPRAYSGANKISFDVSGVSGGGGVAITVDGSPADNFHITLDTTSVTCQQVVNALNAYAPFVSAGLVALTTTGASAFPPAAADGVSRRLAGAVDAERHTITPGGLSAFFSDPANALTDGDTLCVWYDDLVMSGYGGRRQSIAQAPELSDVVDGNLFLLRRFPERMPQALPIATVEDGRLFFINGVDMVNGDSAELSGVYLRTVGGTVTGPVTFEDAIQSRGGVQYLGMVPHTVTKDSIVGTSYAWSPSNGNLIQVDTTGISNLSINMPAATGFEGQVVTIVKTEGPGGWAGRFVVSNLDVATVEMFNTGDTLVIQACAGAWRVIGGNTDTRSLWINRTVSNPASVYTLAAYGPRSVILTNDNGGDLTLELPAASNSVGRLVTLVRTKGDCFVRTPETFLDGNVGQPSPSGHQVADKMSLIATPFGWYRI